MTLSREAEDAEPARPSYVPDGAPWAWVTDGLGKRVPAYVTDGQVVLWSGSGGEWYPPASPTVYGPPLCDELRALLRGEIGWGHKKDSGATAPKREDHTTRNGVRKLLDELAKSEKAVTYNG